LPGFGSGSLQLAKNTAPHVGVPAPLRFPRRDEVLFSNLLASAYSIQRKQDLIRSNVSAARFNEIIATVGNTQSLLRSSTLHRDTAMHLILSRTQKVSGASGAAICIAERGTIEYIAGTGIALGLIGTAFPESECALFTRARPEIEWGELEDAKVKERIAVGFELRAPVCCASKMVGCLKLFSKICKFNPETLYVCEVMAAFLGQLFEKQGLPLDEEIVPAMVFPATSAATGAPHMTSAAYPSAALVQVLAIEPKRNATPTEKELPSRTPGKHESGDSHFHVPLVESEEEQLPTMDELLRQLGATIDECALLEVPQAVLGQSSRPNPASIWAAAVEMPAVVAEARAPASPVTRTVEPALPSVPQKPGLSKRDGSRTLLMSGVPFIFPTFVLIFCVGLSITQPVSMRFQALTILSIIFSVMEIWRSGYGNR